MVEYSLVCYSGLAVISIIILLAELGQAVLLTDMDGWKIGASLGLLSAAIFYAAILPAIFWSLS